MAQLNLFNGGLSTRLQPHLIGANEGTVYKNIDISAGSLVPTSANIDLATTVNKSLYYFNNQWVSSTEDRDYVEFQEKLYYSNGVGRPQKSSDGTTWYNLGIEKPSFKPVVASDGAGVLTGTYQYCFTYYNDNDGTESQPSEFSDEVTAAAQKIQITGVFSTDPQVTHWRLYRIGGDITSMSLVVQGANSGVGSGTYTDNIADIDIEGSALDSYNNAIAKAGLKYLTSANTMFFGSIGDKLYFSDIAYVNYWSEFYFIDFDDTITGIGAVQNGLLVFTKYKTYIVVGNSPTTLSKYLLNGSQGCLLHKSIQYASNTLAWLSTDGICVSTGGDIQVLSRDKLGKLNLVNTKCSAVYDDVYYLSHDNGTLCLDFRFGAYIFQEQTTIYNGLHVNSDVLYGVVETNKLVSVGTSSEKSIMYYKSGRLAEGSLSNIKNYKSIYVTSTGGLTLNTYIDDVLVSAKALVGGTEEVKLPQQERLGYHMQFEVIGTGSLLELEYKAEARQNGR